MQCHLGRIGSNFIFQPDNDNDPKHTGNAVQAYLDRKNQTAIIQRTALNILQEAGRTIPDDYLKTQPKDVDTKY